MSLPAKHPGMTEILGRIISDIMKFTDPGIFSHQKEKIVGIILIMTGLSGNEDIIRGKEFFKGRRPYLVALGGASAVCDQSHGYSHCLQIGKCRMA